MLFSYHAVRGQHVPHYLAKFEYCFNRRYERASTILTSNKSFMDWGEIFGDQVIATAVLDRLLHHSTTLNIKGDSYRLKDKRKAGLVSTAIKQEASPMTETPIEMMSEH